MHVRFLKTARDLASITYHTFSQIYESASGFFTPYVFLFSTSTIFVGYTDSQFQKVSCQVVYNAHGYGI